MVNELDCRNLECPAPVLQVRNFLAQESPTTLSVLVDNEAARQNVSRFFEHEGYQVVSSVEGDGFRVVGTRGEGVPAAPVVSKVDSLPAVAQKPEGGVRKIMVLITSVNMGHGDDGLGDMLMFNFIKTLKEMGQDLWRVTFVNSGVSFAAESSEAVPFLRELADAGVQISACGACLAYFHLLDKIQVGEVTNMLEIITNMKNADSVITL